MAFTMRNGWYYVLNFLNLYHRAYVKSDPCQTKALFPSLKTRCNSLSLSDVDCDEQSLLSSPTNSCQSAQQTVNTHRTLFPSFSSEEECLDSKHKLPARKDSALRVHSLRTLNDVFKNERRRSSSFSYYTVLAPTLGKKYRIRNFVTNENIS